VKLSGLSEEEGDIVVGRVCMREGGREEGSTEGMGKREG